MKAKAEHTARVVKALAEDKRAGETKSFKEIAAEQGVSPAVVWGLAFRNGFSRTKGRVPYKKRAETETKTEAVQDRDPLALRRFSWEKEND